MSNRKRNKAIRFHATKFCDLFGQTEAERKGPRRARKKKAPVGSRAVPRKKARKASVDKVARGRLLFAIGQERLTATDRVKPFTADQKRRLKSGTLTVKGRGGVRRRLTAGRKFREVGPEDLLALRLPDVPQGDPLTVAVPRKKARKTRPRGSVARRLKSKRKPVSRTVAKKAQKVALALGKEIPGFEATLAVLDALGIFSFIG